MDTEDSDKLTLTASSWHSNSTSASPEGRLLLSYMILISSGLKGLKNWKE